MHFGHDFTKNLIALAILVSINACQKQDDDKQQGNANLVFDRSPEIAVEGQDMTLNRIRVWKSAPNDVSPGVLTLVDVYEVEIWATLSGEEKPRYQSFSGLKADEEGNLYSIVSSNQPGSVIYRPNSTGIESYTITSEDGLLTALFPRYHSRSMEATVTNGVMRFSNTDFDIANIADGPWAHSPVRIAPLMFNRTRYVENTNLATKAKMACFVKAGDGAGNLSEGTYLVGDVELGNLVKSKVAAQTGAGDISGDDDKLWIAYQDSWYLTGLNVNNQTLRTYKDLSAPYYTGRELPGVDSDQTAPKISGVEALLRKCNTAAHAVEGKFGFLSVTNDAALSSVVNYCAAFDVASSNEATALTIPLTGYGLSDGVSYCSASTYTLGLTAGSWNGSNHVAGSYIGSPYASYMFVTGTAITETAY